MKIDEGSAGCWTYVVAIAIGAAVIILQVAGLSKDDIRQAISTTVQTYLKDAK